MKFIYLICASLVLLSACVRYNEKSGALEVAPVASAPRVTELEDLLKEEQGQRISEDAELRTDLGKVDEKLRADFAAALEDPDQAAALLSAALKEAKAEAARLVASAESRSDQQLSVLEGKIEKSRSSESTGFTMMEILLMLGVGGAAAAKGGQVMGVHGERKKNGKVPA